LRAVSLGAISWQFVCAHREGAGRGVGGGINCRELLCVFLFASAGGEVPVTTSVSTQLLLVLLYTYLHWGHFSHLQRDVDPLVEHH
jgi:hypothetical protein